MAGRILISGAPGAGKGTQAHRLAEKHHWVHISTGEIFRTHIEQETELGRQIETCLKTGDLVPDALVCQVVVQRLAEDDCANGYILDGFPRTVPQAEALDRVLHQRGEALDAVIVLKISEDEMIERITSRRTCPKCGAIYNLKSNPPARDGVCNLDGAALIQRDDDHEETIRQRLKVYQETTVPMVDYYRRRGLVQCIDGSGRSPDQIAEDIDNVLMAQGAR